MKRMSCLMQKRKSTQSMDSDTESLLSKQSTEEESSISASSPGASSSTAEDALTEEDDDDGEAQFIYARLYKSTCNIQIK